VRQALAGDALARIVCYAKYFLSVHDLHRLSQPGRPSMGDLVNPTLAQAATGFATVTLAALGGALIVFSAFDDAPGGVLIGLFLIASALTLTWRAMRRG
jgi:hypothetical protein